MKSTKRSFATAALALLLMLGIGGLRVHADVFVQCPSDTDGLDSDGDGDPNNDIICVHLTSGDGFAKNADGSDIYIFGFKDVTGINDNSAMTAGYLGAQSPAPPLILREGQKLYLNLTNVGMAIRPDLFDPHTVHFHGFPNAASVLDGEPMASISISMGNSLTYFYQLVEPGTFMYHCHVEASEHMQMGMLGTLYVQPRQNMLPDGTDLNGFTHHTGYKYVYNDMDGSTKYDVEFPMLITSFDPNFHWADENVQPLNFAHMRDTYPMLNGRGYPDNQVLGAINNLNGDPAQPVHARVTAQVGQKILLRIISLATTVYYSVGVSGIPMKVVGRGAHILRGPDPDGSGPLLGKNLYYDTNTVTIGGGETVDVLLDTAGVAPGTYCFYSTNLNELSNNHEDFGGMMTEIVLTAP